MSKPQEKLTLQISVSTSTMSSDHGRPVLNPESTEKRQQTVAPIQNRPARGQSVAKVAQVFNKTLPVWVFFMGAYACYVYCYVYAWHEVARFHNRATGIAFIAVFAVLATLILVCWAQIVLVGPGVVERIPAEEEDGTRGLPDVFVCGPQGFPLWCSQCQSVKPDRVHHSAELGRCVPKMDHMCSWVGTVIGLTNYKSFIQFLFHFILLLLFMVVTMAVYAHSYYTRSSESRGTATTAHLTVIFALTALWLAMLIGFLGVHVAYLLRNMTTLEHMKLNRSDFFIYNFMATDDMRVVSRMRRSDPWPYTLGSKAANFKAVMGPTPLHWLLPIPVPATPGLKCGAKVNVELVKVLDQRWRNQEEGYLAFPLLQTSEHGGNHVISPLN